MLEVGKLYFCEEYFLMLYPDQETADAAIHADFAVTTAAVAATTEVVAAAAASAVAAYWSNRLGKPVSYREKNIPLLVLKAEEKFYEVLIEDKKGWIIYEDFLNIKEIE